MYSPVWLVFKSEKVRVSLRKVSFLSSVSEMDGKPSQEWRYLWLVREHWPSGVPPAWKSHSMSSRMSSGTRGM